MSKLVSIIIPIYNAEQWLSETIQSVLNQSYIHWELILMDDGSTDNSLELAKNFCIKDQRIKLFEQKNKGACAARNKGFELSRGEFIVFFDADDLMFKHKLNNQIKQLEVYGDNFVYSSQWIPFEEKTLIKENHYKKSIIDQSYNNPIDWLVDSWQFKSGQTGIWMCPRRIIERAGKWDESLTVNQDGEFFFRVLLKSKGVKFVDEAYTFYRRGLSNSISNKKIHNRANSILLTYMKYEDVLQISDTIEVRRSLAHNYARFIYLFSNVEKELVATALKKLDQLGVKRNFKVGGKWFRLICNFLGFKNAIRLKTYFK